MTLALDGHTTGIWANGSSFVTGGLTTTQANDVIAAFIYADNSRTVSSLSTTGVVWQARRSLNASGTRSLSLYYGVAASPLSARTTLISLSGRPSNSRAVVFGVSGANTASIPDSNVSLPAVGSSASSSIPTITGISTSNPNDMIIAGVGINATTTETAGAGFTLTDAIAIIAGEYQIVSALQSNVTAAFGVLSGGIWVAIADAIQAAGAVTAQPNFNMPMLGM